MTVIGWAIVFYAVATNSPTVPMQMVCMVALVICTVVELHR